METVFNEIKHSVKNWWTSLLLGIVYIIVALWLMFSPLSSYVALSIVFSISMLISGILEIIFSLSNRKGVPSWGWYLVGGIIDLILGIYLIAYPMVSMEVIPFIILLAHVPGLFLYRLFHRPQTLRHPRLGLVYGLRYPRHHLCSHHIVATGSRCIVRGLHDFLYFLHHRTFPRHAFVRIEESA